MRVYKVDDVKRIELTDTGYPQLPAPENFSATDTYVTKVVLSWDDPELESGESGFFYQFEIISS